jgi:hypothetical protein
LKETDNGSVGRKNKKTFHSNEEMLIRITNNQHIAEKEAK